MPYPDPFGPRPDGQPPPGRRWKTREERLEPLVIFGCIAFIVIMTVAAAPLEQWLEAILRRL